MEPSWPRPIPTIGDRSSASERSRDPSAWALAVDDQAALARVIAGRRDIRRFRPDAVPDELLEELLRAAHQAPSVGHSQPWRFVVVRDPQTRVRAASLADSARIAQASLLDAESARQLLDLDLEGIREAPLGLVVCCDRRAPAAGVLGRATFPDADMWSCAASIQNLWLTARAHGLGVGWVTLFDPVDLLSLVCAPPGVAALGWLCVGWPDERPPAPGLERRGWSSRQPVGDVVISESWGDLRQSEPTVAPPRSRLAMRAQAAIPAEAAVPAHADTHAGAVVPDQRAVVAAHDRADAVLGPPGALGILDRAVDKILASHPGGLSDSGGRLVVVAADHRVAAHGVSAYPQSVTRTVAEATVAGVSVGASAAASCGLGVVLVDAGVTTETFGVAAARRPVEGAILIAPQDPSGDLVNCDALSFRDAQKLFTSGERLASRLCRDGADLVALGEVGVANTTVAAALTVAFLGGRPADVVGLGASSDSGMLERKQAAVTSAIRRARLTRGLGESGEEPLGMEPLDVVACLGGGEIAVLAGVASGAAKSGAVVVLDGLATSVAALVAVRLDPAVSAYLLAGQASREKGHRLVLGALGLEPLLDLRLRAGEGVGATLACSMLRSALAVRLRSARTV